MKVYKESQTFMSKWSLLIMLLTLGIMAYGVHPIQKLLYSPALWIVLLVFASLFSIRLQTVIDEHGVLVHFLPFIRKKLFRWEEIHAAELKRYSLSDYGGWGYRFGSQGIAFTTKGNKGLAIELQQGKKYLIGTQKPAEVQAVLDYYLYNKK